jgi:hypothetical protein
MLVFGMLLCALFTGHSVRSWNDESRLAQVDALAHHGTFAIDDSRYVKTGDKYRYHGHFYSDKPPLLAIYGAAFAVILDRAEISLARDPGLAYYVLTLLTVGAAFAFGLVVLRHAARLLGAGPGWAVVVALLCGIGSLALRTRLSSTITAHAEP